MPAAPTARPFRRIKTDGRPPTLAAILVPTVATSFDVVDAAGRVVIPACSEAEALRQVDHLQATTRQAHSRRACRPRTF